MMGPVGLVMETAKAAALLKFFDKFPQVNPPSTHCKATRNWKFFYQCGVSVHNGRGNCSQWLRGLYTMAEGTKGEFFVRFEGLESTLRIGLVVGIPTTGNRVGYGYGWSRCQSRH